jgi:hypothetical protein
MANVDPARLDSRSSTFRNDSGNRTYIVTTSRITSSDELKCQTGLLDGAGKHPRRSTRRFYQPVPFV